MAIDEIDPLPPAPVESDSPAVFTSKASVFVDHLSTFQTQLNNFASGVNDLIPALAGLGDSIDEVEGLIQQAGVVSGQLGDVIQQAEDFKDQLDLTYQETLVELGGDFLPGSKVQCIRSGNMVQLTLKEVTFTPSVWPKSETGAIPEAFCPDFFANAPGFVPLGSSSIFVRIIVRPDGSLELDTRDFGGSHPNPPIQIAVAECTISYNVGEPHS